MKKLLSILLSACVILSGAIITSSALEDSKFDIRELVVVSPQASPDEASELETVQALIKDKHGYDHVISMGRVGDYGIYYNIPELLLEYNLEYFYGNYHFFGGGQTGRNIPADFGVFVYGKGKLYDIGEAYDNKDIDFDSVVSLIRTYKEEHKDVWVSFTIQDYVPETDPEPVTEPVTTAKENFEQAVKQRYTYTFDNFIQVGELGKYAVYFSNPVNRAVCDWEWESTYGKYKFVVYGGQTGNYEPEDLGLFVFDRDNHTVYNLREAYDNKDIDFDALVSVLSAYMAEHKEIPFTFGIVTEPLPTHPILTPDENFVIEMNNRYGNHFDNFIQVGEFGKYAVYYNVPEQVCEWIQEFTFGKYKFVESGGQTGNVEPEDLGVFVFDKDNHTVYNMQEAYDNKDIDFDQVVSAIRTYAAEHKDVRFTFGIEDIDNPVTEPAITEPATTEPATTVCPKKSEKKANTMKVTTKTKTVKAKKLKKGKVTVSAITVKYAKGKVSYKKHSGSKLLSVTKKGKITVKKWKKAKKGVYKIKVKVTAAGTTRFRKASKLVTVKIKIK